MLLQVIDISDPQWREHLQAVNEVLQEVGAADIPRIQVFNKIDRQTGWQPKVEYQEKACKVWVSAANDLGMDLLKEAIARQLQGLMLEENIILSPTQAKIRARLYTAGAVLAESIDEEGNWLLKLKLTVQERQRLLADKDLI